MRNCIVIPTYNEAKAIGALIKQLQTLGHKIIIIDDGSTDKTAQIAQDCLVEVLSNTRNMGKGAALIKGYNFALAQGFDAVITMDGDGQHACEDIARFIERGENSESAIIVGNRMALTKGMPWLRIITNRFMSGFISLLTKQHIPDTQCGFRLIKKEVLAKMNLSTSKYETESELLISAARMGFKIESIPVQTIYTGQKSQINPVIDTLRFMRFIFKEFTRSA